MQDTQTIHVRLNFPLTHVKEPIIYHLVKDYRLVPNVQQANIDVTTGGMLELRLTGDTADLETGILFLRGLNIAVTRLDADRQ